MQELRCGLGLRQQDPAPSEPPSLLALLVLLSRFEYPQCDTDVWVLQFEQKSKIGG